MPVNGIFAVFGVWNDITLPHPKQNLQSRINTELFLSKLCTLFRLLRRTTIMTNKITYTQQGDYLLSNLTLSEQPKVEIGIWGKRHLKYIKHHRPILYTNLLTSCKLTAYLATINEQAEDMFFRLVKQLAEKEGVTEQLKADNQMRWIQRMNNISVTVK